MYKHFCFNSALSKCILNAASSRLRCACHIMEKLLDHFYTKDLTLNAFAAAGVFIICGGGVFAVCGGGKCGGGVFIICGGGVFAVCGGGKCGGGVFIVCGGGVFAVCGGGKCGGGVSTVCEVARVSSRNLCFIIECRFKSYGRLYVVRQISH